MDERAEKARITAPIGAHAPRSPAPINATRPDFPVRAGQFLGRWHLFSLAAPSESPRGPARSAPARRRRIMMANDSGCAIRARPMPVSSLSLLMRAPDEAITRCNERCDIHVGTAPRACTRRGRPEMAPPRRTSVRTFFRALLQRAVEALLQRGAIPLSYARSHPIEPEMGRDRAAAVG